MRKFDVGELLIPTILELVDHHIQHLGHRVINTLHLTIAIRVVGAGGNFPNPKKLVDCFFVLPTTPIVRLRECTTGIPSQVSLLGKFSLLVTCAGCVEIEDSSFIPSGTMED